MRILATFKTTRLIVIMLALAACTFTLLPARDELPALVALAAGGLLLGGALTAAGVDAGANVAKVLFAASAGMLLAAWLSLPQLVVVIPVFTGVAGAAVTTRFVAVEVEAP